MQNAWLREFELAYSLKKKEQKKLADKLLEDNRTKTAGKKEKKQKNPVTEPDIGKASDEGIIPASLESSARSSIDISIDIMQQCLVSPMSLMEDFSSARSSLEDFQKKTDLIDLAVNSNSAKKASQGSKLGNSKLSGNRVSTAVKSRKSASSKKLNRQIDSVKLQKSVTKAPEIYSNDSFEQQLPQLGHSNSNEIAGNEYNLPNESFYQQVSQSQPILERKSESRQQQHLHHARSIASTAPSTFSGSRSSSPLKLEKLNDGVEFRRAIGSPGGHIAREDPDFQLSGNSKPPSPIKAFQFQTTHPKSLLKYPSKKFTIRPEWNSRFVLESPLSEPIKKKDKSFSVDQPLPSIRLRDEIQNYIEAKPEEVYTPTAHLNVNTLEEDQDEVGHASGLDDSMSAISMDLVLEAERLWATIFSELRDAGTDIQYAELVELASVSHPHILVESVVGYLCILLGIKPDWETAKRSLFKQIYPLLKFIREVDPVTIPPRRLKKARKLKETNLGALSVQSIEVLNRSASKLMRWLLAFDSIAKVILSADKRRKQLKRLAGHGRDRGTTSALEDPNEETVESYMLGSSFGAGRVVTAAEQPSDIFPERQSEEEADEYEYGGGAVILTLPSAPNPTFAFGNKSAEEVSAPESMNTSTKHPELLSKGDRHISSAHLPDMPENANLSLYADMLIPGEDVVSGESLYNKTGCYLTIKKTDSVRISEADTMQFMELQRARSFYSSQVVSE